MTVISIAVKFLVAVILLRFWLQLIAANYYNPVSRAVAGVLAPVVNPLQKIVPVIGRCNCSVLLLALLVNMAFGYFLIFSYIAWWQLLVWGMLQTVSVFLFMIFWMVIASVVISWIASGSSSSIVMLINEAVAPVIDPVRRLIPPIAGLDFSPVIIFLGIQFLRKYVLVSLYQLAGVPLV